jgi:cytochrome c oxidase cbb3-type subunit 4
MDSGGMTTGAFIDMGLVRGLITALTMLVYLGIFRWAYHRGNRDRFEEDALLPFADDGGLATSAVREDEK